MIPIRDDNPTQIKPIFTVLFIVVCCAVFLWQYQLGDAFNKMVYTYGLIPAVIMDHAHLPDELDLLPSGLTVFTSMFLHGGWMHLLGNMLYLWIFGNNVEDAMGHVKFIIFYFTCGVIAAFSQVLPDPTSTIPMIGASGAISGILGAYLMLYPKAKVLVVVPLLLMTYLPAGLVLALWFALQIVSSYFSGDAEGGVAWGAHIGGFVAGMVLVVFFKKKTFHLFADGR